jgi:uncharacterized membrane protein YidH (DUF202 family)
MSIESFLGRINLYILNPIIVFMFVVALLVFFWGLVQFIYNAGSDSGRDTGKQHIIWGIVGMFIMVAVYGIIGLILNTFGLPSPEYIAPML